MKIVYVFPQLARFAGTERILIDKMNYLANHYGYEVYALTYEQGQAPIAFHMSEKVTHVDLDTPLWQIYRYNILQRYRVRRSMEKQLYKRFMAFISQIHPDIVIVTPYHEIVLDLVVHCPYPMVRIVESHLNKRFSVDSDPILRSVFLCRLMAWRKMRRLELYISNFDCLVALNQTDADDWSKYVKTKIIANMAHLNDGALSNLNAKSVIFAGRYTKQKGIHYLFKVWEIVHTKHSDWHLHLYGEVGEEYDFAIKEAERLGSNIHVNRSAHDIFAKYRENSILVLTSIYEPFGLVMPEAMSCGLPVVAFDCPYGPANIITDGEDGFLVKTCDVQSFANRICLLIEDEELRRQMGKKAMASSQRYSAEIIMPKWNALFESFVL